MDAAQAAPLHDLTLLLSAGGKLYGGVLLITDWPGCRSHLELSRADYVAVPGPSGLVVLVLATRPVPMCKPYSWRIFQPATAAIFVGAALRRYDAARAEASEGFVNGLHLTKCQVMG